MLSGEILTFYRVILPLIRFPVLPIGFVLYLGTICIITGVSSIQLTAMSMMSLQKKERFRNLGIIMVKWFIEPFDCMCSMKKMK